MNDHPSPEFEKELRDALGTPQADPVFVRELRATLLERSTMTTQPRSFPRLAWALALAILLIGLLIASPRVVEALKRLFGYVPGIGYVEQTNSLRLLAAPVTLEKEGLRVTIQKGTADHQHTVLLQHIEGYIPDRYSEQTCLTPARLVLPDGTILNETRYETSLEGGKGSTTGAYYGRYVFEALPAGQMDAALEIPCVMYNPAFTDYRFPLHFAVADLTREVSPVIELPTSESTPQMATQPASLTQPSLDGFAIQLESETSLSDGYILSGSYTWTDPRFEFNAVQINDPKITDADGHDVPFETVEPPTAIDPAVRKVPFAYQIHGKEYAWPLTIAIHSIIVNLPEQGTFQFDAGPHPQVGQTWDTDIDVSVAGHIVHVQSIQLTAGRTPTELGFTFTLTSDPDVMGVSVSDAAPITAGSGGGGGGGGGGSDNAQSAGPITYGWALDGYSPGGLKTFVVSNLAVRASGTWQVTWQPSTK